MWSIICADAKVGWFLILWLLIWMNKNNVMVTLVLIFLRPCARLANYFGHKLIQFLSSYPWNSFLIKSLCSSGIKDCIDFEKRNNGFIGSAIDLLLNYILYFGRKIQSCELRISVIKRESDRETIGVEFRWWINKRWYFWRSYEFYGSKISALILFCRGNIVKILCSNGYTLGGAATGFEVENLVSLKMEYCFNFSGD